MTSSLIKPLLVLALVFAPVGAYAQNPPQPASSSSQSPPRAGELEALVAPIALYPDTLLSEVLMASTYPLEVVQAERWLSANKGLKGDQLKDAVDKQAWDDSVKSLIATPSVLEMMSSKIDWTHRLGKAVIDQQADVMDAVQRLRAKAQANNKLQSTKQQNVVVTQEQGRQVIAIQSTDPNTVYVPYYDPSVVYGEWPYSDYPPYYWPAPGYIGAGLIAAGIAFGTGYALGRWGGYWRGNVNWNGSNIAINRPGGGAGNWNRGAHVEHRLGNRGGRQQGLNFRGSSGQRVLNAGGGRGALAERRGSGQRTNAGNRGGGRQHVANRPSRGGGNRGNHVAARPGGARHAGNLAGRGGLGGGGMHRAGGMHGGRMYGFAGGGFRGGGGGFRGGGGSRGGRRSDIRLKHDIQLLGYLDSGLGFYRFSYNGSDVSYVGVMAQEVQRVVPQAVMRDADGYLRVSYPTLGLKFETYRQWIAAGGKIPRGAEAARNHHN
jgi:hypothetical protein